MRRKLEVGAFGALRYLKNRGQVHLFCDWAVGGTGVYPVFCCWRLGKLFCLRASYTVMATELERFRERASDRMGMR